MVALRGPGWGLAPCLVDLIHECDELAPNRSTVSDGSVGDLSHQARESDHNPDDGWVCAVDVTDDKAGGCDADLLARHIVARRDPRVKYVIWNGTIVKSYVDSAGHPAWEPYPYAGTNPHDKHTHVSVHNTAAARNDLSPWWPVEEEGDMFGDEDRRLAKERAELATRRHAEITGKLDLILAAVGDDDETGTLKKRTKEITLGIRRLLDR